MVSLSMIVSVIFVILSMQFSHLAQPQADGIQLIIVPERVSINTNEAITLVVVVENNTAQDIRIDKFEFVNNLLVPTQTRALATNVMANSSSTGIYNIIIDREGNYTLVGSLTYSVAGKQFAALSQAEINFQSQSGNQRDYGLILIGAFVGVVSGLVIEVGKFRLERNRQADKARGTLLFILAACAREVEQNRDSSIEIWQEIYLKEGLHSVLARSTRVRGKSELMLEISSLYVRLREYNTNRQLVDREKLREDLLKAYDAVQRVV